MELERVVTSRRMTRNFSDAPVDPTVLDACIDLASRAPSAGKTQGWHLVVLEGDQCARYWDTAFPVHARGGFAFPGLFTAPVIALVVADPAAYLARYSESDKVTTGLGASTDAWVAPYWTIDASFATMTLLLALEDAGLGALFFAHANEPGLRAQFGLPDHVQVLGTIAIGHPAADQPRKGVSASRPRNGADVVVHRGNW